MDRAGYGIRSMPATLRDRSVWIGKSRPRDEATAPHRARGPRPYEYAVGGISEFGPGWLRHTEYACYFARPLGLDWQIQTKGRSDCTASGEGTSPLRICGRRDFRIWTGLATAYGVCLLLCATARAGLANPDQRTKRLHRIGRGDLAPTNMR